MAKTLHIQQSVIDSEAEALRVIYEQKIDKKIMSQAAFAKKFHIGTTQSSVNHYLRGRQALNLKAALKFATGLKCQVSSFSPRLAKELDIERIFAKYSENYVINESPPFDITVEFDRFMNDFFSEYKRRDVPSHIKKTLLDVLKTAPEKP